ncbi:MAG TPA: L,D-transpeptidase family protein [Woeseiaceae bacterium]|nr:L,D-transpeptidase family protein [Woeseiaceae bacterium]
MQTVTTLQNMCRVVTLCAALAILAGCSGWNPFVSEQGNQSEPATLPDLASLPLEAAIDPNRFIIEFPEQSVVGVPQVVFARHENTLHDFALEYGVGYDELVAANPGVDPWLPGDNRPIILPTQFVLPDAPREGVILNIAAKRLFYYPADGIERDPETGAVTRQTVLTFPVGIGRVGWETPLGQTKVVSKARNPTWWVPASVRKEHAENGDPLPAVVPPGPDNPLGTRVLKLGMPGYLIHGTNQPYGVGMRVSHGCVRLYPENIEFLYELVDVGEPVLIINEPYLLGQLNEQWYFEAHAPLEDDNVDAETRLSSIAVQVETTDGANAALHLQSIASSQSGLPVRINEFDESEVLARVRRVENTIEVDPDAPTLDEVREMIDEVIAERDVSSDQEKEVVAN